MYINITVTIMYVIFVYVLEDDWSGDGKTRGTIEQSGKSLII